MFPAKPAAPFVFKNIDRDSEENAVSDIHVLFDSEEDYFLEDPGLTDVTLLVEDKQLHVPKSTLMQASPVFRAMFTSGFKEKDAQQIELPDKKYESFALFLRCIFPNEYIELDEGKIEKVLPLADEYDVNALKLKCQGWLLNEIRIKLLQAPGFPFMGLQVQVQKDLEFFVKCMYYGAEYDLNELYTKAFDQVVGHKASRYWHNEYYRMLKEKQKCELLESRMKKIEESLVDDTTVRQNSTTRQSNNSTSAFSLGQSGASLFGTPTTTAMTTVSFGSAALTSRQFTIPSKLFK